MRMDENGLQSSAYTLSQTQNGSRRRKHTTQFAMDDSYKGKVQGQLVASVQRVPQGSTSGKGTYL